MLTVIAQGLSEALMAVGTETDGFSRYALTQRQANLYAIKPSHGLINTSDIIFN